MIISQTIIITIIYLLIIGLSILNEYVNTISEKKSNNSKLTNSNNILIKKSIKGIQYDKITATDRLTWNKD